LTALEKLRSLKGLGVERTRSAKVAAAGAGEKQGGSMESTLHGKTGKTNRGKNRGFERRAAMKKWRDKARIGGSTATEPDG